MTVSARVHKVHNFKLRMLACESESPLPLALPRPGPNLRLPSRRRRRRRWTKRRGLGLGSPLCILVDSESESPTANGTCTPAAAALPVLKPASLGLLRADKRARSLSLIGCSLRLVEPPLTVTVTLTGRQPGHCQWQTRTPLQSLSPTRSLPAANPRRLRYHHASDDRAACHGAALAGDPDVPPLAPLAH